MRVITCLVFLVLSLGHLRADDDLASYWPLTKGTYWIYEGDVSWVEKNPATGVNQIYHKHLTWRSEVIDVATNNGVPVALLHGFSEDLAWYNSKTQSSDSLVFLVGTDYYRMTNKALEIFQRIKGPGYRATVNNEGDTNRVDLFLPTPLMEGKEFGVGDVIADLFTSRYCSLVEAVTPFDLRSVKNAPKLKHPLCYSITCHTNPDNDQLDFVPGLGITSYYYLHHGTTMEVSVHLIEFGQPSPIKGSIVAAPAPRPYRSKTP
jgi:hypothetical protein